MLYVLVFIIGVACGWAAAAGKDKVLAKLSGFFGGAKEAVDNERNKGKGE